ncbi:MAG: hypothetical protein EXS43_14170 [Opitutus sp.]|nr:hypothetical protein [Opitutus sp.]
MKLSRLLANRQTLNRQAYLANLAFSYFALRRITNRVSAARLHGRVRLQAAVPAEEIYWPTLLALAGNQSVIEEHFSDEDILHLTEAIAFAREGEFTEIEFELSELEQNYVAPLRRTLAGAGINLDLDGPFAAER